MSDATPSCEEYSLLTCTRYDPFLLTLKWNNDADGSPSPFLLLPYHLHRLIDAADRHVWPHAKAALSWHTLKRTCQQVVDQHSASSDTPKALKIRLILDKAGVLTATATPINPLTSDPTVASFFNPMTDTSSLFGPVLTVYLDSQPSSISIFTFTKTTNRTVYNEACARKGLNMLANNGGSAPMDVLLYNPQGLVTETSISNVAIYRSPHWITPHLSAGCLPGVLRRWLLEQGRIREDDNGSLTKETIQDGDWILLLNGVHGCRLGRVYL